MRKQKLPEQSRREDDHALKRGHLYREAGADVLFVEVPETEQEVEAIAESLRGTPLLFNWAEGGKTSPVSPERLRQLITKALQVIKQQGRRCPLLHP